MSDRAGYFTLNGDAGFGFSRAYIKCDAEIASASDQEVLIIPKW